MERRVTIGFGVVVLAMSCIASVAQQQAAPIQTTICKVFEQGETFDGNIVRLKARYAGSWEGAYLIDDTCQKAVWFTTPEGVASVAAISVPRIAAHAPAPQFSIVKDGEYKRFVRFAYSSIDNLQMKYDVTATFTGRVDHCKNFELRSDGFGNGFGQMGRSEFQFVMESVSDVKATESQELLAANSSCSPRSHP